MKKSELNWLPSNSMLNLKDDVMTFKCLKNLAPTYLSERYKQRSQVHNCNTTGCPKKSKTIEITYC